MVYAAAFGGDGSEEIKGCWSGDRFSQMKEFLEQFHIHLEIATEACSEDFKSGTDISFQ